MFGEITRVHGDLDLRVIQAEDRRRYRFATSEIIGSTRDLAGEDVELLVDAQRPRQIVRLSGSIWTALGDIRDCIANDR